MKMGWASLQRSMRATGILNHSPNKSWGQKLVSATETKTEKSLPDEREKIRLTTLEETES
jgi:hypothetical protein